VLSDSLSVRDEAMDYSLNLALRTDSFVVVLLLVNLNKGREVGTKPAEIEEMEKNSKKALEAHSDKFRQKGVYLELWLRVGDPISEFLKFLAGIGSFQAIVWGGTEDVISRKGSSVGDHWVYKVKGFVDSPLLIPSKREQ